MPAHGRPPTPGRPVVEDHVDGAELQDAAALRPRSVSTSSRGGASVLWNSTPDGRMPMPRYPARFCEAQPRLAMHAMVCDLPEAVAALTVFLTEGGGDCSWRGANRRSHRKLPRKSGPHSKNEHPRPGGYCQLCRQSVCRSECSSATACAATIRRARDVRRITGWRYLSH